MKRTQLAFKDIDGTFGEAGIISANLLSVILEYSTDLIKLENNLSTRIKFLEARLLNPILFNQTLLNNIDTCLSIITKNSEIKVGKSVVKNKGNYDFEKFKNETALKTKLLLSTIDKLSLKSLEQLKKETTSFGELSDILIDNSTKEIILKRLKVNLKKAKSVAKAKKTESLNDYDDTFIPEATEISADTDKLRIVLKTGIYDVLAEKLRETGFMNNNQISRILMDLGIVKGDLKTTASNLNKLLKKEIKASTLKSDSILRKLRLLE